MRSFLLFCLFTAFAISTQAQSYAFGIKGGLTIGTQRWDQSFDRSPLFRYHGIVFIESVEEDSRFSLFAQAGYHLKGSAIRTFPVTFQRPDGSFAQLPSNAIPFEFRNISVTAGGKQKFDLGLSSNLYYLLGIRGDYTLSTQLRPSFIEEDDPYAFIYPFDDFVNKFNYGIIVGGGIEFPFSEYVAGLLELTVNPDFSKQYNQPEIRNVINPNPGGGNNLITIPERQITNLTMEITLGIRFLHKIEYIDD